MEDDKDLDYIALIVGANPGRFQMLELMLYLVDSPETALPIGDAARLIREAEGRGLIKEMNMALLGDNWRYYPS